MPGRIAIALALGALIGSPAIARAQAGLGRALDAPHPSAGPASRAPADADDRRAALLVGGGIAIAATVVGLSVWVGSYVRIQDINADPSWGSFRESVPAGTPDACATAAGDAPYGAPGEQEHARAVCTEGSTLEIVEWVSLGGAILAAGAALALFIAGEHAGRVSQLTLAPVISPSEAGLVLRLAF